MYIYSDINYPHYQDIGNKLSSNTNLHKNQDTYEHFLYLLPPPLLLDTLPAVILWEE